MSIPATNSTVGDLITEVESQTLIMKPFFQRRLVWTNVDKERFIETVLLGFPFPEIFIATGERIQGKPGRVKWLVDGLQRVSTLHEYYRGSPDLVFRDITPYAELEGDQRDAFLDYPVAIRDLGPRSPDQIKKVFHRINSTDYALTSMERLNAMFSGSYKKYCESLADHAFFKKHAIFTKGDRKRMYDLSFCVILVTTLMSTYYHREEKNEEYLERYNDLFEQEAAIAGALDLVFKFIEKCEFPPKARPWKKTDLFTLIVELHSVLVRKGVELDPKVLGEKLASFYQRVDETFKAGPDGEDDGGDVFRYLKAATKATNDKYARLERCDVIAKQIDAAGAEVIEKSRGKRRSSK